MSALFGPMRQLGVVVRDFDQALRDWTEMQGIGPFFIFRAQPVDDYRYLGKGAVAPILSIGFAYSGDLQIEIIHQHNDAPSGYLDFLAAGREGVHHVSSFTDRPEFDATYARIMQADLKPIHEGAIGGVRFAYFDTLRGPGSMICEISESAMEGPRAIFAGVAQAARDWDGTRPIRLLGVD